jgi:hypothetical protein
LLLVARAAGHALGQCLEAGLPLTALAIQVAPCCCSRAECWRSRRAARAPLAASACWPLPVPRHCLVAPGLAAGDPRRQHRYAGTPQFGRS